MLKLMIIFQLIIILALVSGLIALYIQNKKKLKDLQSNVISTKSYYIFRDILESFKKSFQKDSIYESAEKIISILTRYYHMDYCTILALENKKLYITATNILDEKQKENIEAYSMELLTEVEGKPGKIKYTEDNFLEYPSAEQRRIRYLACLPMVADGEFIGMIIIENRDPKALKELEEEFFKILMDNITTVMQLLLHYSYKVTASLTDHLTGVPNKRDMDKYLFEKELSHRNSNTPFTIAMVDIDKFKSFNDTYGHQAGDIVLQEVAKCLKDCIRGEDRVGRYGGEEFILYFPYDKQSMYSRIDKIRTALESKRVQIDDKSTVSVTASFGVAEGFTDGATVAEVIHAADKALYKAKDNGRNRVELYNG